MLSRRRFLTAAVRGPAVLALGSLAPGFLLRAMADEPAGHDDRVLVVVQLSGGNDGLNTVIPFTHDVYRKNRPKLAIPAADVLKIDGELGFHPAARGFADLLEQNRLAIVQGVGYPDPNRSHFESMDIWHTCLRKHETRRDGWLGRYLDQTPGAAGDDVPAIHLGGEKQPFALTAQQVRTPTIHSLDQFKLKTSGQESRQAVEMLAETMRPQSDDLLGFVQTSTTSALDVSERFSLSRDAAEPAKGFPETDLGRKLGTIAKLITSGLRTRIYYVEVDGFDTHSQQAAAHEGLLRQVGDAVSKFVTHLANEGAGERALVMCFSEFGRRVEENASEGTDHGAAAPMFLAGQSVRPGLIGAHPSLEDLDQGDLKHHTDFRQVYATVLEQWLGRPSETILGGSFSPIAAVAQ